MKLPKAIVKEGVEAEVIDALEKESFQICIDPDISIPSLELNPELRKYLFYAKSMGEMVVSYESIEKELAAERKGLQNVGNQSDRISRLLIVTNDGSPRFYKELKFLQHKQGQRVLICRLDIDSLKMGEILNKPGVPIKAILINRKSSVVNVLKALKID